MAYFELGEDVRGPRTTVLWLEWEGFYADDTLGQPQVVTRDGSVLDANSLARQRGIVAGMTVRQARNIVPDLLCSPWSEEETRSRSHAWLDLILPYADRIEPIDGHVAAVDLSDHPRPLEIAERLTETLIRRVRLPLRSGIGPSKWIAALAVGRRASWRQMADLCAFLDPMPVEHLTPIDSAIRERLSFLGYRTIGQVAALPLSVLRSQFGEEGWRVRQAAIGVFADPVVASYPPNACMASLVFETPPDSQDVLDHGLKRLAGELAQALSVRNEVAKQIELTLELEEGTRSVMKRTFVKPLTEEHDLMGAFRRMLPEPATVVVERIRVALPDLKKASRVQLDLESQRRTDAEASLRASVLNVRTAFGENAVKRGSELTLPRWQRVRNAYRVAYGWAWI